MTLNYMHHPGLAEVQFKTFFHMCKLESIFFDFRKRDGSQFMLYDTLQSALVGLFTTGCHRKQAILRMIEALGFFQNQAGSTPVATILDGGEDTIQLADVIATVRGISRALELKGNAGMAYKKKEQSFLNSIT
jgi:hypothetical protein